MIGLLILAEKNLGTGLIATVVHTLGSRPPQLDATELDHSAPPEQIETLLRQGLQTVDRGEGALILADVYGATHTNIARTSSCCSRKRTIGSSSPVNWRNSVCQ